jgi:hypothetical protein
MKKKTAPKKAASRPAKRMTSVAKEEMLRGRCKIFKCASRHGRMNCMSNGGVWMGTTCMTGWKQSGKSWDTRW